MKQVSIFCDGSAIGNPGPGGWGTIVSLGKGRNVHELGGFSEHTTNNRMELTAAIQSLTSLKDASTVTVHTDSRYVINGVTKWVHGWIRNSWMTSQKTEVLNKDLWEALVQVTEKHTITWEHVRAHTGIALNERADMIANGFARTEHVSLFTGEEKKYEEFLKGMPKARVAASSKKGKVYSYVSLVEGVVLAQATWTECEKRVKGQKAKFKKVFSKDEEGALIALWKKE